ncbi:MAG: prepilin-type N-terminal cleavage/methylation domain-containing protein [Spirochaetota bacterium]|nr:prepilin-type N-terminal cleavage/methylation domain-containing protein [Spirochaetota bacterium]
MFVRNKKGFAIIEILIAITILSIAIIGIISGVSAGIIAISGNRNLTKAMIIAKNKLNEFQLDKMRGTDIDKEPIEEYPNFFYSREIKRFEHDLLGPIDAKKVTITVFWEQKYNEKSYTITYIYPWK